MPHTSFKNFSLQTSFSAKNDITCQKRSNTICFILAGGKSTRMNHETSKVLLPVGGRPALLYIIDCAQDLAERIYLIVSSDVFKNLKKESIINNTGNIFFIIQDEPLGTGHAFSLGLKEAQKKDPYISEKKIIILLGDCPLIQSHDLKPLLEVALTEDCPAAFMGMNPPDPSGYGRFIQRSPHGYDIVEDKEWQSWGHKGTEEPLCNTGVMILKGSFALKYVDHLPRHHDQYYITDFACLSINNIVVCGDWSCFLGMNTPTQRQYIENLLQKRFREKLCEDGVYMMAPETVFLSYDTKGSPGVVIHPYCFFGPKVILDSYSTVFSFSHLQECHGESYTSFGPFAHVRGKTHVQHHSHVGSFMEIKESILEPHTKAKHFGYIGNAHIGSHSNIGAGVIFCNYDGQEKHKITIEENNFIGAGACLVAPLHLGKNVTIGANSVITKNVPPAHLSLSRPEQRFIPLKKDSKYLKKALNKPSK